MFYESVVSTGFLEKKQKRKSSKEDSCSLADEAPPPIGCHQSGGG